MGTDSPLGQRRIDRQPDNQRPGGERGRKAGLPRSISAAACLVVADGFYEWRQAERRKQPYYIRMHDHRPFAFAGLWDHWNGPQQESIESCVILTTDANAVLRPLHDRMPVILAPAEYSRWLDASVAEAAELTPLLDPFPADEMTAYAVDTAVNSPRRDDPSCIEPIPAEARTAVAVLDAV